MFSSTILTSALVALFSISALATPSEISPRADEVPAGLPPILIPESIANATALGIDLYGDFPSDGVVFDDHWEAEPGTLAWAYIRAQQDLVGYEGQLAARGFPVQKRQGNSDISVNFYKGDWCTGAASYWWNPNYNIYNWWGGDAYYSFGFTSRTLRGGERVELRRQPNGGGDACANYHTYVDGPTGAGLCWNIGKTQCFRIIHT